MTNQSNNQAQKKLMDLFVAIVIQKFLSGCQSGSTIFEARQNHCVKFLCVLEPGVCRPQFEPQPQVHLHGGHSPHWSGCHSCLHSGGSIHGRECTQGQIRTISRYFTI